VYLNAVLFKTEKEADWLKNFSLRQREASICALSLSLSLSVYLCLWMLGSRMDPGLLDGWLAPGMGALAAPYST